MEIAEFIYKVVAEPSYKKTIRADKNRAGHSKYMRVEASSSDIHSKMAESANKHRKRYADYLKHISKPKYLIHGPVHS